MNEDREDPPASVELNEGLGGWWNTEGMTMSTFSGDIGREEEDGAGWGGLAPTKAEREEERRRHEVATRLRVLTAERDHARAKFDAAVHLLTAIHALLYPASVKTPDGKTMVFRPSILDPHEVLQELSDRIRALPDELANLKTPNVRS